MEQMRYWMYSEPNVSCCVLNECCIKQREKGFVEHAVLFDKCAFVFNLGAVHKIAKSDYWLRHVCLSVWLVAGWLSVLSAVSMEQLGSH
jgi:hypothetical protein